MGLQISIREFGDIAVLDLQGRVRVAEEPVRGIDCQGRVQVFVESNRREPNRQLWTQRHRYDVRVAPRSRWRLGIPTPETRRAAGVQNASPARSNSYP